MAEVLLAHPRLREAGEALIARANEAGGRDNITVVLLRLEDARAAHGATQDNLGSARSTGSRPTSSPGEVGRPTGVRAPPPRARGGSAKQRQPRRARWMPRAAVALAVLGRRGGRRMGLGHAVGLFHRHEQRGLVTLFRGVPYELPGGNEALQRATSSRE